MLPKKDTGSAKEIKENPQRHTSSSSWNVTKESTSRDTHIPFPQTKGGEALQRALFRYQRGERRGEASKNFSPEDARTLIKNIKNAEITSKDIDSAVINVLMKLPDISDTERARKFLLDLSTDMGNTEEPLTKKHNELINQPVVDNKWERLEKKLPDSPALQATLKYVLEKKTGIDLSRPASPIEEDTYTSQNNTDAKLKSLPVDVIENLQNAAKNSKETLRKTLSPDFQNAHEQILATCRGILLKCDNYPNASKGYIKKNKDIAQISSLSAARDNLSLHLKSANNKYLSEVIEGINRHLSSDPN